MRDRDVTLRVARPTDRLAELTQMYVGGLGLGILADFVDHDGFDGVVLGCPGARYHLEFTTQHGHAAGGASSREHLLVFYIPAVEEWQERSDRMRRAGFRQVASHNPYWDHQGRTFEDLDGYRVVLFNASWPSESEYVIAPAREQDLSALASIELAAAQMLVGQAPESVLLETTALDELRDAQRLGCLWVARCGEVPVGFAHVKLLEPGVAHLDELDVQPDHGRRGIGTRLVRAVCRWAAANGCAAVTLATFRDVAWNMPFYSRLGFTVLGASDLSPALRALVQDEARRGLDPKRRVVMRRPTDSTS